MAQLYTNNAVGYLLSSITNTSTTIVLQAGQGALFPTISNASDYFMITIYSIVDGVEYNHEIIKVQARSGDSLTCTRAQEGTLGRPWAAGAPVECRITAQSMSTISATALFATPPTTISTTTYTILATDISLIFTNANCTVTMPTPASNRGRLLFIRNKNLYTDYGPTQETSIVSASTNILGILDVNPSTNILPASAGKFVILQSDGTNWVAIAGS
jgi:hypothetical protein